MCTQAAGFLRWWIIVIYNAMLILVRSDNTVRGAILFKLGGGTLAKTIHKQNLRHKSCALEIQGEGSHK